MLALSASRITRRVGSRGSTLALMAARKKRAKPQRPELLHLDDAPPRNQCQHLAWTVRGNELHGRATCPSCGPVRLREALSGWLRAVIESAQR